MEKKYSFEELECVGCGSESESPEFPVCGMKPPAQTRVWEEDDSPQRSQRTRRRNVNSVLSQIGMTLL